MTTLLALDTATEACSVAVLHDGRCLSDYQVIPRLHAQRLLPMILREAEFARLDALPPTLRPIGGRLVFSIKEAVYKAIYPSCRVFLDFQQVEIAFSGEDGFVADVLVPGAAPRGFERLHGRFRVAHGHMGAAVVLPAG